jgi:DNA-binding NarL/FixJ family response regulator
MSTPALPEWFASVVLAESVSAPLVILAARAGNAQPPDNPAGFLSELARQGVLVVEGFDSFGGKFRLRAEIHTALLNELEESPGGVFEVRERLLRYGLVSAPFSLIGQLAMWASQNSNWAELSELWLKYPPAVWASVGPAGVAVFSAVPTAALVEYPELAQAAAVTAGLRGLTPATMSELAVRRIRQDGRLLHEGWRSLKKVDSAVRAGSMWMVAQRTLAGSPDDLEDAWLTHHAVRVFINEQSLAGNPPSSRAETFFHAMSAETALLRGDVASARTEAEEATVLGEAGDVSSLIGAGLEALTQALSGDLHGFEAASARFAERSLACGPFTAIAAPYFEVGRALIAIRLLDRARAEASLHAASAMQQRSEFWSLYAWITSLNDLTWQKADVGLARLEAAVSRNPLAVTQGSLIDTFEIRARTELLCGAGRVNQDQALLKARARSKLSKYHVTAEARMYLCGQDGASAVRVAEHGIHDASLPLPDRAHLMVIKAAGLLAISAEADVVLAALHAACTLCNESANLLPFVFLPGDLRVGLLKLHDSVGDHPGCLLARPELRARLEQVQNNFHYSPAPIKLTAREEILLPLLATSTTIYEIARQLQVSVNTVRKQVVTLRVKLDAKDRHSLVEKAYQLDLLAELDHQIVAPPRRSPVARPH